MMLVLKREGMLFDIVNGGGVGNEGDGGVVDSGVVEGCVVII